MAVNLPYFILLAKKKNLFGRKQLDLEENIGNSVKESIYPDQLNEIWNFRNC
jgi:hypothetical protein